MLTKACLGESVVYHLAAFVQCSIDLRRHSVDLGREAEPQLKAADAARKGNLPTAQPPAAHDPRSRVALSRASESVQCAAKASPGGHQEDGY
jgi:hypothetical protein